MPRTARFRLVALALAGVFVMAGTEAEAQWKWKDKGGRVQYSDLPPPPGTPEADILSRPTSRSAPTARPAAAAAAASAEASAAAATARPPAGDPELEARRKKAETEQAAKAKVEEDRVMAAKAENCKRAQTALRGLESGLRITRANDKGEREFLDDRQRAEETKRTRDTIAADCPR